MGDKRSKTANPLGSRPLAIRLVEKTVKLLNLRGVASYRRAWGRDCVTSRAQATNCFTNGLRVRFFTVAIPTATPCAGNLTGKIFKSRRLALSRATAPGRSATKRPDATSETVKCMESATIPD